jgi:hypothetical protein
MPSKLKLAFAGYCALHAIVGIVDASGESQGKYGWRHLATPTHLHNAKTTRIGESLIILT